jgi:hypothetical protein
MHDYPALVLRLQPARFVEIVSRNEYTCWASEDLVSRLARFQGSRIVNVTLLLCSDKDCTSISLAKEDFKVVSMVQRRLRCLGT